MNYHVQYTCIFSSIVVAVIMVVVVVVVIMEVVVVVVIMEVIVYSQWILAYPCIFSSIGVLSHND